MRGLKYILKFEHSYCSRVSNQEVYDKIITILNKGEDLNITGQEVLSANHFDKPKKIRKLSEYTMFQQNKTRGASYDATGMILWGRWRLTRAYTCQGSSPEGWDASCRLGQRKLQMDLRKHIQTQVLARPQKCTECFEVCLYSFCEIGFHGRRRHEIRLQRISGLHGAERYKGFHDKEKAGYYLRNE